MVEAIDTSIGLEKTLIIYASDNGGCKDNGGYNTPLRGGKHHLWEGGVRVPAFVTAAFLDNSVVGSTYKGMFHVTDWMPTIFGIISDKSGTDVTTVLEGDEDGMNQWENMKSTETTVHITFTYARACKRACAPTHKLVRCEHERCMLAPLTTFVSISSRTNINTHSTPLDRDKRLS